MKNYEIIKSIDSSITNYKVIKNVCTGIAAVFIIGAIVCFMGAIGEYDSSVAMSTMVRNSMLFMVGGIGCVICVNIFGRLAIRAEQFQQMMQRKKNRVI